jgi:fructose/tagatose bisphosphate aldolase
MPLTTPTAILRDPNGAPAALASFTVSRLGMLLGVLEAAEAEAMPLVVALEEQQAQAVGLAALALPALEMARRARVPVAVHLNHARRLETVMAALDLGFTSVMFDGSALVPADNAAFTRRAAQMAHRAGVDVEAELGPLDEAVLAPAHPEGAVAFAAHFLRETGADMLAFSVPGNGGVDPGLVHRLAGVVPLLVLHGASRLPSGRLNALVASGVRKVNVHTTLRRAFLEGLEQGVAAGDELEGMFARAQDKVRTTAARILRALARVECDEVDG